MAGKNSSKLPDLQPHDAEATLSTSPQTLNWRIDNLETSVGGLLDNMIVMQTSMAGLQQVIEKLMLEVGRMVNNQPKTNQEAAAFNQENLNNRRQPLDLQEGQIIISKIYQETKKITSNSNQETKNQQDYIKEF